MTTTGSTEWLLRVADGSIYGPVALPTLCEWASQARIGPGCALSADREHWIPAEEIPELELDWIVELPGQKPCGPLHLKGVFELARDQGLPSTTRIVHRFSKTPTTLADLPLLANGRVRPAAAIATAPGSGPQAGSVRAAQHQQAGPTTEVLAERDASITDLTSRGTEADRRVRMLGEMLTAARREKEDGETAGTLIRHEAERLKLELSRQNEALIREKAALVQELENL